MPLSTGGRNVLRSIAVGGALVGSLAMASSASAALGGAASATFVNRPNLQSVTFNGLVASYHFDKPVQPGPGFNRRDFTIGGYRASAGTQPGAAVDTANISISDPRTVLVTFSDNEIDFNAATFGAVAADTVQGYGTFATPNLVDATALTGSASESGTRGHTAGPDLQSVALDPDNNEIDFIFDQDVEDNNPNPGNLNFYDASGAAHFGDNVVDVDDNVVTVAYTNDDIKSAQIAYVLGNVLGSGNLIQSDDDGSTPRTPAPSALSVDIPGKAGATGRPKLKSAVLEPGSSTVVYTFDQNIATADASDFRVNASTGGTFSGSTATIIGKDVRVTFLGVDLFTEHLVSTSIDGLSGGGPAVTSTNPGNPANLTSGVAIGGNAGAKASGYTSAPDALSATMNPATGQVTVLFDSRILPAFINESSFELVGDNGVTVVGTAVGAPTVQQAIGAPTQARVILQFQPTDVALASAIHIRGNRNIGNNWQTLGSQAAVIGTAPVLGLPAIGDDFPVATIIVPSVTSQTFKATK